MGNGLRFPYLMQTELRGRSRRRRAGNGKTGPSAAAGQEENPLREARARRGANLRVAKREETAAEKSRYGSA